MAETAESTKASATNGKFDPATHLTDISGKQYLEVKWRLAWLRDDEPNAFIETELKEHQPGFALFRASVTLPSGGSATGWGAETESDFGDYIEKAETKALGRALAALGYGTQFCMDFDEGGSVTDSPVAPRNTEPRSKPGGRWPTIFGCFPNNEAAFEWLKEHTSLKVQDMNTHEWNALKAILPDKVAAATPSEMADRGMDDPGPQESG